ncbi:MAG: hypothetical protein CMO81_11355 [Waddliaceae bacterium]|nr:hypothetical protein [Waddliaceae bacterium]
MIIANNSISNHAYVPYQINLNNLQKSAQRLASGEKYAFASEGSGELGVAERFRMNIKGVNALLSSMEGAAGYGSTQDAILGQVVDIVQRMHELASSALDPTKTTEDYAALDQEFKLLDQEIEDIAANSQYNGTRLFETTTTIRIGLETTDTVVFSRVRLSLLSFSALSVSNTTAAQSAISRLSERIGSLTVMRGQARNHGARMERALAFTRSYVSNLSDTESRIRNIDLATETTNYTKQQMIVNTSQALLAQASRFAQSAQQFLNF